MLCSSTLRLLVITAAFEARANARVSKLHADQVPSWQTEQPVHPTRLPCKDPIKRAPVRFPEHLLIGSSSRHQPVMYSGYVNVTMQDYLFYWFTEAERSAPANAPLIVWSNGGPGCSAMEGATTEHGPLVLYGVKESRQQFGGRLFRNPYSWNKEAHVLYVDQPRYVGYSCGTGDYVTSSREAGLDMVTFLRGWRMLFPEHAGRNLILAAESYGGHYVPAWSSAILDYNRRASDPFPLSGLAIGNGIVDMVTQERSFPEFAKQEGLVPEASFVLTHWEAREIMTKHLGYPPNFYDFRIPEEECCGCSSYNYKAWSDWLLRSDVTTALNVCGDAGVKAFADCAAGCIQIPDFDKDDTFNYVGALSEALQEGIRVTLYYGMTDIVCNYVGGWMMAHELEWSGSMNFANASMKDLRVNGLPTGKFKSASGLTWVQVEGAGHMVPANNPAAGYFAIRTLMPDHGVCECAGSGVDDLPSDVATEVFRKFHEGSIGMGPVSRRLVDAPYVAVALLALIAACMSGCAATLGVRACHTWWRPPSSPLAYVLAQGANSEAGGELDAEAPWTANGNVGRIFLRM